MVHSIIIMGEKDRVAVELPFCGISLPLIQGFCVLEAHRFLSRKIAPCTCTTAL
jgi:hypothetical protein